ncbi:beta-lactoglobulin-2-like [Mesoplodon densirostris]|uniref:beta-lactoglobulin-2-like n=1 Tax=Mesoplodon densirostris TaxID=48708 RepID=UPI0028DC0407|nr:beta-lactoglobulin-2-like [Mesoplodon densirostris]
MKSLLLALGLALVCGAQAVHIPNKVEGLDIREVAGTWHSVAMAASDISLLDAESGPLRVNVEELRPTPQGDLEITLQKWENQKCVEKTILAQKTEDPAVFKVEGHRERKISVLDTDYTNYMIFCMEAPTPTDEHGTMCQCLSRTLKVGDDVVEKFDRVLESLPEHMRIFLDLSQRKGELSPAHGFREEAGGGAAPPRALPRLGLRAKVEAPEAGTGDKHST